MKLSHAGLGLASLAMVAGVSACGTQASASKATKSSTNKSNATVATVNKTTITQKDLNLFVNGTQFLQGTQFPTTQEEKQLEAQALVDQVAVNQWVLAQHLTTEKKAKAQAKKIISSQIQSAVGSKSKLKSLLKSKNLTMASLETYMTDQVLSEAAFNKETKNVKPTLKKEKSYYSANKANFTTPPQDQLSDIIVKKQSLAKQIVSEAKSGTPFATLAKKYSTASNAKKGGEMGYEAVSGTVMSQALYTAVQNMKVGQYKTFKASGGQYHIIWLQATKPAKVQPFSKVKSQVQSIVTQQVQDAAYQKFVKGLVKKDKVTYAKGW